MNKFIEKWKDVEFKSSSSTTDEFRQFATELRAVIVKTIKPELVLIDFSRGHFYCSGFLKHRETPTSEKDVSQSQSYIYFSISDVRHFKGSWIDDVLLRTAKHPQDYTGGRNNSCKLTELRTAALNLINE